MCCFYFQDSKIVKMLNGETDKWLKGKNDDKVRASPKPLPRSGEEPSSFPPKGEDKIRKYVKYQEEQEKKEEAQQLGFEF